MSILRRNRILCLLFLVLIANAVPLKTVMAQEKGIFRGTIVSDEDDFPLVGAHVKLKSDPSYGAAANTFGEFVLRVNPGRHIFTVSYTGMLSDTLTLTIKAGETIHRDFRLKPYVNQFEAVEIKVGKFDRSFDEITVSMEVIKPGLIESKNTTNIKTILDLTPGLIILDDEPQIRGGSGFTFGVGSKVAVIVDDMPMLSADAGRPYWDFVPVENIAQIEVVKGASSVLSGANALSGAIYIRTKQPTIEPETNVKVYTGAYSAPKDKDMKWWSGYPYIVGADFLHSRMIDNVDLVVGGNVHFDHGYLGAPKPNPGIKDTITNFSDQQMATKRGRLNFNFRKRSKQVEGLNYGVNGNVMISHHNLTLAWLDDTTQFYRAYPGAVVIQDQVVFNVDPFINFYSKLGIRHSLKARVLHNNVQGSNNQDITSTMYFADYNFKREYDFLKNFAFIGGLTFQYNDVSSNLYTGSGSTESHLLNASAYLEMENNFFDLINLSLGARLEYFSLNDSTNELKPIFRVGASMKMLQETFVRFSFGQGFRYPTIAERNILTNMGSFAVFNNPDLQSESSWNAEVGVKQGFKFLNFFGYFDLAIFQQEYKNTIEYLFGFWDPEYEFGLYGTGFKFLNTGKSRITGIDISMNGVGKMGKNGEIKILFGYNYIVPKTLEPDLVFAYDYNPGSSSGGDFSYNSTSIDPSRQILKYRFLHNIKADVEFGYKGVSFGVSMKYFSRIENLDKAIQDFEEATVNAGGTIQPILYMDYFNKYNNGNFIMDLRLAYQLGIHRFSIISDNVLNRWYSLRPLKAEPVRKIVVQYALKF